MLPAPQGLTSAGAGAHRAVGGAEGIVNGMDSTDWNPAVDKFLDVQYDARTVEEGKAIAKETLQAELGLEVRGEANPCRAMHAAPRHTGAAPCSRRGWTCASQGVSARGTHSNEIHSGVQECVLSGWPVGSERF